MTKEIMPTQTSVSFTSRQMKKHIGKVGSPTYMIIFTRTKIDSPNSPTYMLIFTSTKIDSPTYMIIFTSTKIDSPNSPT